MNKWILAIPFMAMTLWFCQDPGDQESPVITVNSLSAGDTIIYGQPMTINAHITDNNTISEYTINIRNEDIDVLLWTVFEVGVNSSVADIDTSYNFSTNVPHNWLLRIEAVDADGNQAIENVNFFAKS